MKIKCVRCDSLKDDTKFKKFKIKSGYTRSKHCMDCAVDRKSYLESFRPRQLNPICRVCNCKLTHENWNKSNMDKKKRCYICKICNSKRPSQSFESNKNSSLIRKYNISIKDFKKLEKLQKGRCGICKKKESVSYLKNGKKVKISLSVDHCHQTGKVRGLLCTKCNRGLGNLCDSIQNLENAILYIRKSYET